MISTHSNPNQLILECQKREPDIQVGNTTLLDEVCKNAVEESLVCAKFFLDKKIDVNTQDTRGKTPLHSIAYGWSQAWTYQKRLINFSLIKLLLEQGANISLKDDLKNPPLDYLLMIEATKAFPREYNYLTVQILIYLLQQGATLSLVNSQCQLLGLFCDKNFNDYSKNDWFTLFKLLLEKGGIKDENVPEQRIIECINDVLESAVKKANMQLFLTKN